MCRISNVLSRLSSLYHSLHNVCTLLFTCPSDKNVRHVHQFAQRGGSTLIYSYIHVRRLGSFFGVQIVNFSIYLYLFIYLFFFFFFFLGGGGSEKSIFFGDMKILLIFFGGNHKIGLYLGVISMRFRVFCKIQGTECMIFIWVA